MTSSDESSKDMESAPASGSHQKTDAHLAWKEGSTADLRSSAEELEASHELEPSHELDALPKDSLKEVLENIVLGDDIDEDTLAYDYKIQQKQAVQSIPTPTSSEQLDTTPEEESPIQEKKEEVKPTKSTRRKHPNLATRPMRIDTTGLIGQVMGNVQIVRKLGRGSFGTVYEAEHVFLKRSFAVKLLTAHQQGDKKTVLRFRREADALSQLNHENVVRFHDFGALDEDEFYIVMEYLEGESLQKRIHDKTKGNAPYQISEIQILVQQICDALGHIHQKGIIHRDLKPSNIFLHNNSNGMEVLKVFDFGIAALMDTESDLTETGTYIGTARYVSPEQVRGEGDVDGRADLYSLGIILFLLLAGRTPFVSKSSFEMVLSHLQKMPPTLTEVEPSKTWCPELEAFVAKALAKDKAERPLNAMSFKRQCLEALERQRALEGGGSGHPLRRELSEEAIESIQELEIPLESLPETAERRFSQTTVKEQMDFQHMTESGELSPHTQDPKTQPMNVGEISDMLLRIAEDPEKMASIAAKNQERQEAYIKRVKSMMATEEIIIPEYSEVGAVMKAETMENPLIPPTASEATLPDAAMAPHLQSTSKQDWRTYLIMTILIIAAYFLGKL